MWLFSLITRDNASISFTTYGARLTSVRMPNASGDLQELTLGYDELAPYLRDPAYLGATVGRFANRIRKGRFSLEGIHYQLPANEGEHHLHGGPGGFHQALWEAESYQADDHAGLRFSRVSEDGEEGYPGRVEVEVEVLLKEDATLQFSYRAWCDRTTLVNLTNHAYWNLGGEYIGEHYLQLSADQVLSVDEDLLPTGEKKDVTDTPLDFRQGKLLDEGMQSFIATDIGGIDHCFILQNSDLTTLRPAARLYSPATGMEMQVYTTMPGMQVYTGNRAKGILSRMNKPLPVHNSVCLETQFFPDSPNVPGFIIPVLRPGEEYVHHTCHKFISSSFFQNKKTESGEFFSFEN